ncbi:MAG TPA: cell division protein ZipA C-terminal FtsZ-binding domain-containing protein [Burkholderiales bacterium]|nr:cell division protein ZipA C-terminal FtsZ-binding domain-containing protein [Burkholderiales bacterium]
MSELQIGLLAIGALVVVGVLAYNRIQERGAKRSAERAFRSSHADVLLDAPAMEPASESVRGSHRPVRLPATRVPEPDAAIDYIVEFSSDQAAAQATIHEQWAAIARRHAPRALLGAAPDGKSWRAGLQLVSRDGAVGEADLIEFRSAVETLAASVGATVAAPEMRAAVDAARTLDDFCADADIQVVVHVQGGPFAGTKIRATAEAGGLTLENDGKFSLRNDDQQLLYTLAARNGAAFTAAGMKEAAPAALTLALDVARTPDTRRSFESMTRLAHQLAAVLGGSMVDDNGNSLDERAIGAIAQQLDTVRAQLEARGVPPGGPAALRLFS